MKQTNERGVECCCAFIWFHANEWNARENDDESMRTMKRCSFTLVAGRTKTTAKVVKEKYILNNRIFSNGLFVRKSFAVYVIFIQAIRLFISFHIQSHKFLLSPHRWVQLTLFSSHLACGSRGYSTWAIQLTNTTTTTTTRKGDQEYNEHGAVKWHKKWFRFFSIRIPSSRAPQISRWKAKNAREKIKHTYTPTIRATRNKELFQA